MDRPDFVSSSGGRGASGGTTGVGGTHTGGAHAAGNGGDASSGSPSEGGASSEEGGAPAQGGSSGGSGGDTQEAEGGATLQESGGSAGVTGGSGGAAPETCDDPDQTQCEGSCVNLASDANHCRVCGHSCGAGSKCSSGVCQPVLLHTSPEPLTAFDVDDASIFFSPAGVSSCPNTGCKLSPDGVSSYSPGVVGNRFVADGFMLVQLPSPSAGVPNSIFSLCPTSGCTTDNQITVFTTSKYVSGADFMATGNSFYWTEINPSGRLLERCSAPAGAKCERGAWMVDATLTAAKIVAASDEALFFSATLENDTQELYSCPGTVTGCTPTPMKAPSYREAVAYGEDLYLLSFPILEQVSVGRCPRTGCASIPKPVVSVPTDASRILVDASGVYWIQGEKNIQTCPLTGCVGAPFTLAKDIAAPRFMRSQGGFIYWVNAADNTIWRVAKPASK
ncbi:MAG TPA: hypothetical protein VFQ61_36595 [Polyangiaceae bacterium]|nr:hypothetical protein [Polyangiaceae bacterium]